VGELTGLDVVLDGLDEFEAAFPDARRVTIPGQRHLAVGFAPEVFAELVASFVQKVDAAAERS
jgi:hypothetical protein